MSADFSWPTHELGMPLRRNYRITVNSKQRQKEVYGGFPRLRANNPLGAINASLSFRFSEYQMFIFRNFYENVISFGKEYFNIELRTAKGVERVPVLMNSGYTYELVGASSYDVSFDCVVKKETKTSQPDGRDIIDALYGVYPAKGNLFDSRIGTGNLVDPGPVLDL